VNQIRRTAVSRLLLDQPLERVLQIRRSKIRHMSYWQSSGLGWGSTEARPFGAIHKYRSGNAPATGPADTVALGGN
jgi:hypothetical protein